SVAQTLFCTEERVRELITIMSSFSPKRTVRKRELLSLIGKLSFAAAVLPGARPFLRRLIDLSKHASRKHHFLTLNKGVRADLSLWLTFIRAWNGRQRWRLPNSEAVVISHDASLEGFGFCLEYAPPSVCSLLPPRLQPGNGFAGVWSKSHLSLVRRSDDIQ